MPDLLKPSLQPGDPPPPPPTEHKTPLPFQVQFKDPRDNYRWTVWANASTMAEAFAELKEQALQAPGSVWKIVGPR